MSTVYIIISPCEPNGSGELKMGIQNIDVIVQA